MPHASIPHKDNKSINNFELTINGNSIGRVKVGIPTLPKQVVDILNSKTLNPVDRQIFLKAPIIELTTLDLHWDVFAYLIGITPTDESVSTADLDKTIAFKVYEDYAVPVNKRTFESGLDTETGLVLATTPTEGGVEKTEDTDYAVDYTKGTVIVIVGGGVSDGDTLYVRTGKYNTQASKKIHLGKDPVNCAVTNVLLTHDFPNNSADKIQVLTIKLHKADITSDVTIPFGGDEHIGLPMTITGLEDSSQAKGQEWGYLDITTTA